MVEKFKILPRVQAVAKGAEETKGEQQTSAKKVSMGKGYFSLETAPVG